MKKNVLKIALMAMAMTLGLASCIGEQEESPAYIGGYYTITGDMSTGYTLYQDGGGIVNPDMQTIYQQVGKDGFANRERAYLIFSYKEENLRDVEGGCIISGAQLMDGNYIPMGDFISVDDARDKNIVSTDSLFNVSRIVGAWVYRGYLTTTNSVQYAIKDQKEIYPTTTLVYDPASVSDNKVSLTLCYNRHAAQTAAVGYSKDLTTSFPITDLARVVPGSDSINVTLNALGAASQTFKVGRIDLRKGDYLPYKK